MVDASGQAEIRGIDIDKLAKGFADEENILKKFCTVSKTKAREIRWYKKTAGFLDSVDTTGITASQIANVSERSRPVVVEQSWTRQTNYVRKYFVESPTISIEDIKDSDIDILATNVRDLVRAVGRQVDARIFAAMIADASIGTAAAVGTGWDDTSAGDPILDIMTGIQVIRSSSYKTQGAVLYLNPIEHKNLILFLISVKGSSIPQFATEKVRSGVVMQLLGLNVVVSENATTDEANIFVPQRAMTWKMFSAMTSTVVDDPGIGKKIRVWEEGEILVTDPSAIYRITDTVT